MSEDEKNAQGEQQDGQGSESCKEDILYNRLREQEAEIAALRGEIAQMRTLPHVVGATPGGVPEMSRQQFAQMSYGERVKLRRENPALYAQLSV